MNLRLPSGDVRVCWQPGDLLSSRCIGLWLPAILLIGLTLAGCSGSGSRGYGYADTPPTNPTALVAWQEWTRFGRSTVVYGGHAGGYVNRSGLDEHSEPLSARVGDYWGSCGHPEWNGNTRSRPWSGAFISWVMRQSGARDFPFAGRHGQYLAALYDREFRGRSTAFLLHAPDDYAPKPGDLACSGTAGPSWRHASPATAHRRIDNTARHCDVVTDVRGGFIQAVGGNVKSSVTMSLYPIDGRGRLAPTPGKLWMLVVENRAN